MEMFSVPIESIRRAKFLGYEGDTCDSLTRGLLRRSHIIANRHRYIGKETSRRWEQGDDTSLVDFRCAEYAAGMVIASNQIIERILEMGIRKATRAAGIDGKTVMLITRREPVKPSTLAKVIEVCKLQNTIPR